MVFNSIKFISMSFTQEYLNMLKNWNNLNKIPKNPLKNQSESD